VGFISGDRCWLIKPEQIIEDEYKCTVINLFGGPGAGKSTTASLVFGNLKQAGVNCELVQEYAKDKVWEESYKTLENQLYVLGKQSHRQFRCKDKVDVIITDAPLLLSLHYGQNLSDEFKDVVRQTFDSYNNVNYLVERGDFDYNPAGRTQTEDEATEVHKSIRGMLNCETHYKIIPRGELGVKTILDEIRPTL